MSVDSDGVSYVDGPEAAFCRGGGKLLHATVGVLLVLAHFLLHTGYRRQWLAVFRGRSDLALALLAGRHINVTTTDRTDGGTVKRRPAGGGGGAFPRATIADAGRQRPAVRRRRRPSVTDSLPRQPVSNGSNSQRTNSDCRDDDQFINDTAPASQQSVERQTNHSAPSDVSARLRPMPQHNRYLHITKYVEKQLNATRGQIQSLSSLSF